MMTIYLVRRHAAILLAVGMAGWGAPAFAECMSRPWVDAKNIPQRVEVAVPPSEVRQYQALGFTSAVCSVDAATYRKRLCGLVSLGNSSVQRRLEQVLGASPAKMCVSARMSSGLTAVQPEDAAKVRDRLEAAVRTTDAGASTKAP